MSRTPIKPMFFLADSSLLFWRPGGRPFLECLRVLTEAELRVPPVTAAYLGASNRDEPAFYEIFTAAMEQVGITRCRMIPSQPTDEDRAWLAEADVLLLAGGDPRLGWESFQRHGLESTLRTRYLEGAVLMGLSAGAMQLGMQGWSVEAPRAEDLFGVLGLAPFLVSAHEAPEWRSLRGAVRHASAPARGIGIPFGGGLLLHPDQTLEPVRHPLVEIHKGEDGTLREALLHPPQEPYRGEDLAPQSPPTLKRLLN